MYIKTSNKKCLVIILIAFLTLYSCKHSDRVAEDNLPPEQPVFETIDLVEVIPKDHWQRSQQHIDLKQSYVVELYTDERANVIYSWTIKSSNKELSAYPPVHFYGGIDALQSYLSEVEYIQIIAQLGKLSSILDNAKHTKQGMLDRYTCMIEELYNLGSALKNVGDAVHIAAIWDQEKRNIATERWSAFEQLLRHSAKAAAELAKLTKELNFKQFKELIEASFNNYWNDRCDAIAVKNGFSIYNLAYPKVSKPIIDTKLKYEMAGSALPEFVLYSVVYLKLAKTIARSDDVITATAKLDKIVPLDDNDYSSRVRKYFITSALSLKRHRNVTQKAHEAALEVISSKPLHSLVQPDKLSQLKIGARAGNPRFKKLMYQLHCCELAGIKPELAVQTIYKKFASTSPYATKVHVYAPKAEIQNLVAQYRYGKKLGLYTPKNLEQLRHGRAPIVSKGAYKGETVEIDHLIPKALSPELENSMANLTWLPASANRTKSASITKAAIRRSDQLQKEINWSPSTDFLKGVEKMQINQ